MATARKGDLVLVQKVSHDYVIGQGRQERVTYQFGVVASATREGVVKTYQSIGYGDDLLSDYAQPLRHDRCWVMSARAIDVNAVLAAAKLHHYPNHPGQPMPFDSIDEARILAREAARQSEEVTAS